MSTKIFVGNLGNDVSSDDVRPVFEEYGTVEECDVLINFGFVHMSDEKEAKEAVENLNGTDIKGQRMRVELSTGKRGGAKDDRRGGYYGRDREGGRPRPYPPGPPRHGPPPPDFDPYFRYPYERDPYYRMPPIDRYPYPPRLPPMDDRYPYPPLRRARLHPEDRYLDPRDRYLDPRDRYPDPRDRYLDPRDRLMARERLLYDDPYYDRLRALERDPYYRERSPLGARPPPEYYDRKAAVRGPPESSANPPTSHPSTTAYPPSNGQDLYRRPASQAPECSASAYGLPPPATVAGPGQPLKNGPAGPIRPPVASYSYQVPAPGQQQQQYPGQQHQYTRQQYHQQQYAGQQYPSQAPAGSGSFGMQ